MGRKRKVGRPKGSKNKKKKAKSTGPWYPGKRGRIPNYVKWGGKKRRGRPPGVHTKWSKTKKKSTKKKRKGPGRPPGIHTPWGKGKNTKRPGYEAKYKKKKSGHRKGKRGRPKRYYTFVYDSVTGDYREK